MRNALAAIVFLALGCTHSAPAPVTVPATAATPEDSAVRTVVMRYLHGLKFNDTVAFRDAFLPDAKLMFVKNDGSMGELTQAQWYRMFNGVVGKEEPGELSILSVDVSGTAASVKVRELYPGNPGSEYVDYLNLLRIGGEWRIVNKIYVASRMVPTGKPFAVDAAGSRVVPGDVRVQLVDVPEDSRCAIGVQCVWAGRARVRFRVDSANSQRTIDLRTDSTTAVVFAHTITLDSLLPYPRANQPIAKSQYRAWVRVTRD